MRRGLRRLALPLREPFTSATAELRVREIVVLRIEDDDGAVGFGEAAPLEHYDGVSIGAALAALRANGGGDGSPAPARACEEMARLDLQARREDRPLAGGGAFAVAVNATLPAGAPAQVALRAASLASQGYDSLKIKVGDPADVDRVAAVRQAVGAAVSLRVDANGAWTPGQAVDRLRAMEPDGLEFCEQPCETLEELARVRRSAPVEIAADEPIRSVEDVRSAARAEACEVVVIKLSACGGFNATREAVAAARDAGLEPVLASTLDGPWGIAAALQLASAEGIERACGLATLPLFDCALASALPEPELGWLGVPAGPGLGVSVSQAALDEVTAEEIAWPTA